MACVDVVVASKGDGLVDSVSVLVGITHTFAGDLVLKLVSPSNTVVTLVSRPGVAEPTDDGVSSGGDSSNLSASSRITFRDGSPTSAENMGGTISDSQTICQDDAVCVFAPSNGAAAAGTLATFTGQAAAGTWRLCAGDGLTGDTGTVDFVRLSVVE
jgi:subtilisin-like proprotein convertase family protein